MTSASLIDPFVVQRCPVTGLVVTHRSSWSDVELVQGYSVSFCVVGERILVSAPKGNAGRAGIPRLFEVRERVLREIGVWNAVHLELKDYSRIDLYHPREARSQFANLLAAEARRGYLRGYFGYNGTPALTWILRVGRYLADYSGPSPVAFVRDYREAALRAADQLRRIQQQPVPGVCQEWSIALPDCRFEFKHIGQDVLYCEVPGMLPVEHADRFFALYEEALSQPGLFPHGHRLIVRLRDFSGGSWYGRQVYLAKMSRFAWRHMPKQVVVLGGTRAFHPVMKIHSRLVRYPIEPAADLEQAMALIEARRAQPALRHWLGRVADGLRHWTHPARRFWTGAQLRGYTEEILKLLGSINWEISGDQGFEPGRIDPENPLGILVEALGVLKQDFDVILRDRAEMSDQVLRAAKLASLGTLTAGLAHELNNPLAAVLGFAQRLERSEDPETRTSAEAMVRAGRRMKVILDKLLQADRDLLKVEQELVDLNRAVHDALLLFEQQFKRHRITVELKLQPDLPRVGGNVEHFEGVVHNLLANAQDALEDVGERQRLITITTSRQGPWVRLEFTDNGCGMDHETARRVFDPFFTTKPSGQGAGLGLFISQKIVDQYHGSITLKSDIDEGAALEILLPAT